MERQRIDLEGLIAAIETELPDIEHYLDLRSGEVLTVVKTDETEDLTKLDEVAQDNLALSRRIKAEPEAYERVPSITAEAGFRWMQEWSSTVADKSLRERLQRVLRGCSDGCFKAFRRELCKGPEDERERWFAFREEKLAEFVNEWLAGKTE